MTCVHAGNLRGSIGKASTIDQCVKMCKTTTKSGYSGKTHAFLYKKAGTCFCGTPGEPNPGTSLGVKYEYKDPQNSKRGGGPTCSNMDWYITKTVGCPSNKTPTPSKKPSPSPSKSKTCPIQNNFVGKFKGDHPSRGKLGCATNRSQSAYKNRMWCAGGNDDWKFEKLNCQNQCVYAIKNENTKKYCSLNNNYITCNSSTKPTCANKTSLFNIDTNTGAHAIKSFATKKWCGRTHGRGILCGFSSASGHKFHI